MTPEQQAAYINAQTACATIEATGMQAENMQRALRGESMAYDEEAFMSVIDRYGIHHNSVMSMFRD